jgi:hypothetical protein
MADGMQYAEDDPRHHNAKLKALLAEAAQHVRHAQALIETTAEVLGDLETTYGHYEN